VALALLGDQLGGLEVLQQLLDRLEGGRTFALHREAVRGSRVQDSRVVDAVLLTHISEDPVAAAAREAQEVVADSVGLFGDAKGFVLVKVPEEPRLLDDGDDLFGGCAELRAINQSMVISMKWLLVIARFALPTILGEGPKKRSFASSRSSCSPPASMSCYKGRWLSGRSQRGHRSC